MPPFRLAAGRLAPYVSRAWLNPNDADRLEASVN